MKTRTSAGRRIWPWVGASLLLHLLVLASVPGVNTPARCPVMLVSLVTTHAAEKEVEVVKPKPLAPPEQLQKGTPKQPQVGQVAAKPATAPLKEPTKAPAVPPAANTPIVTSNTSAENTAVVPIAPPEAAQVVPEPPARPGDAESKPAAPSIGDTPNGEGDQGGTADKPTSVPAKPSIDVRALMAKYGASVNAKVQRSKYFPEAARTEKHSGTVVNVRVSIDVARNGSLISVSASSDVPELSRAAEEAVRNAAPFGSFPDGVEKQTCNFTTTLVYKLR